MKIENIKLEGKKVLMRVDFNVPLNDAFEVSDDTRLKGALPTIRYILENGASLILMSHLGRPQKKKKADGSIDRARFSLRHLVNPLSNLLNKPVLFVEDCIGGAVQKAAADLAKGEVLVLENTRFYPEESKGDVHFARQLADLADVYVNDAFGTAHRAHASTATVAQFFSKEAKAFGFLIQKELDAATQLTHQPQRPFTAIVGGAKVSDKILLLEKLVDVVDHLIIGGGMAYTLIKAQGGAVGASLLEADKLEVARGLMQKATEKGVTIYLPTDSVVADKFDNEAKLQTLASHAIPNGWMGLDVGPKAVETFKDVLLSSKSIIWNGPMGVFEMPSFAKGTMQVADIVVQATQDGAYSLIGGGDSVAAINKAGKADKVSFVSTGGGAMLKLLEGGILPAIEAINK
jgi:phosphoglycerate kinase